MDLVGTPRSMVNDPQLPSCVSGNLEVFENSVIYSGIHGVKGRTEIFLEFMRIICTFMGQGWQFLERISSATSD